MGLLPTQGEMQRERQDRFLFSARTLRSGTRAQRLKPYHYAVRRSAPPRGRPG